MSAGQHDPRSDPASTVPYDAGEAYDAEDSAEERALADARSLDPPGHDAVAAAVEATVARVNFIGNAARDEEAD